MNPTDPLTTSLTRAIRSQDHKWILQLTKDPHFPDISPEELDDVLSKSSTYFQESDLIQPFITHPKFSKITPDTLGKMLLAAMRLDNQTAIKRLLYNPHLDKMSAGMVNQVVIGTLDFQGDEIVKKLMGHPRFKQAFDQQLDRMILSAIRTQNREWMEQLFKHPRFPYIYKDVFRDLTRWTFRRRDKKLINYVIRFHHFRKETESILREELFNSFLERESNRRQTIELYVVEQLMKHPDYPHFSPQMISWMIEKTFSSSNKELFDRLTTHPHYPAIEADSIAELFIEALQLNDREIIEALIKHGAFNEMSGEDLGLILEEAVRLDERTEFDQLLHHPHFREIPDDSFKCILTMKMPFIDPTFRKKLLQAPSFKDKAGKIIYEAIRRNESGFIDLLFHDLLLKNLVVEQLINYTQTDKIFVNEYVIRDVLREGFLTNDQELIHRLATHPLFQPRVKGLIIQAIQFDDDELIESFLLDSTLKSEFKSVLNETSLEDKKRLYRVILSNSRFTKKHTPIIHEIHSWFNPENV